MAAQIYPLLSRGEYGVTADSGSIRDPEGLFVTRKQSVTFRGNENALIKGFKIGGQFTSRHPQVSTTQPKMLCGGPESMRLVDYTANDPHWDAEISWVGIHKSYSGDDELVFRVEDEFARVETTFPKTGSIGDPATDYVFGLTAPFVPDDGTAGGGHRYRGRIITFVPTKKVIGVIKSTDNLSPAHPKIFSLVKAFKPPDPSLLKDWRPQNAGQGRTGIVEPLWTWAVKYMEAAGDSATGGAWVPANLQVRRQLSVGDLFVFTMDVPFEQRVTPG